MKIRLLGTRTELDMFAKKLEDAASKQKDFIIEKWTGTMPTSNKDKTCIRYYQIKLIEKK